MTFPSAWVMRWARPIVIAGVALALLFLIPLRRLEIDAEIKNQLPPDMPARQHVRAIEERFGGSELVMVVVEAADVLSPPTLERLRRLSDELGRAPGVQRVLSPFSLSEIQGGADGTLSVEKAIHEIPSTPAATAELRARLERNPLVMGNVIAKDFRAATLMAVLAADAKDAETVQGVREAVARVPGQEAVRIGGMPVVRQQVSEDIRADIRRFAPIGLLVMLGFLWLSLRQAYAVMIPFGIQLLAIIVTMGLIPLLGWKMQMVTVTLPVVLLAIGNDHTVHLVARYQEARAAGGSPQEIAGRVLSELGFPVLTAGITTVAGFACLVTHVVIPAAQLGVLAAIGLGFVMVAAVTIAPALLSLSRSFARPAKKPTSSRFIEQALDKTTRLAISRPRAAIATSVIAAALASVGLLWLEVDTNPINYYPASAPVPVTARALSDHFGGSVELSVMVEGDILDPSVLGKIDALEAELGKMPEVGYTLSVARIVRAMYQAVAGAEAGAALPDQRETISQLFLLYSMGGSSTDLERWVDFDYRHALVTARLESLSTSDIASVVERTRAYAGREMSDVKVTVGGFGVVFTDLVAAIIDGQVSSLALSIALVFILNAIGFGSLGAGLWSMIPLVLGVPALFGLMGIFGIELNVVTAMLSSIVVGVGVDYGVHLLWEFREQRRKGQNPEAAAHAALAATGRGITFNALAVVLGFSVLAFSNFLPVQFFGFLVVVSIGSCWLMALFLLPPLLVHFDPRFARPASGALNAAHAAIPGSSSSDAPLSPTVNPEGSSR
jgi:hydrophobe/amphiphile efflux-3 (HAE3) family protein